MSTPSIRMNSTPISAPEAIAAVTPLGFRRVAFRGLASAASWTLAASVAAAISQWLLLMATAKLGSAEMVGQLALSFAIVAPIQALTDLALRPALATDARRDFHFSDYLELRMKMIVLAVAAVARRRRSLSLSDSRRRPSRRAICSTGSFSARSGSAGWGNRS